MEAELGTMLNCVQSPMSAPCARAMKDEKMARTMNGRIAINTTARCIGLDFIHSSHDTNSEGGNKSALCILDKYLL